MRPGNHLEPLVGDDSTGGPGAFVLTRQELLELEGAAVDRGEMRTHVRPLSDDARVTLPHADPDLFFE
ncbi:MAG: hypothetical protein V5A55_08740 [Halovenus sp.]